MKNLLFSIFFILICVSCGNDDDTVDNSDTGPYLIIDLKFDIQQERLNNIGEPATIPANHSAQSPFVRQMSSHYIELAPNRYTLLGEGEILYHGEETLEGGQTAVDFDQAILKGDQEEFLRIPLSALNAGQYEWVRVSITYQEGEIEFLHNGNTYQGTLASFVGFNTYISNFTLNQQMISVHENKKQGFWAFESNGQLLQGQAPEGATTVPNPLFDSSPIPQGSCVVTGAFESPLVLTGNETEDITMTLSFSIKDSFEWVEINSDGKYEPSAGETVVDMGLRGLKPSYE